MYKNILLFVYLSFATLLLSGCMEKKAYSFPTDTNGETMEHTPVIKLTNKSDINSSMSSELPKDFPSYIPFPSDYQILNVFQYDNDDGGNIVVSYYTETDDTDSIVELYSTFMNQHEYEYVSKTVNGMVHSLSMIKNDQEIDINITNDNHLVVTISIIEAEISNSKDFSLFDGNPTPPLKVSSKHDPGAIQR